MGIIQTVSVAMLASWFLIAIIIPEGTFNLRWNVYVQSGLIASLLCSLAPSRRAQASHHTQCPPLLRASTLQLNPVNYFDLSSILYEFLRLT